MNSKLVTLYLYVVYLTTLSIIRLLIHSKRYVMKPWWPNLGYYPGVCVEGLRKPTVFWDVEPCSLVRIDRRFRGSYFHHHRPDDGSSKQLWNVVWIHDAASQKTAMLLRSAGRDFQVCYIKVVIEHCSPRRMTMAVPLPVRHSPV